MLVHVLSSIHRRSEPEIQKWIISGIGQVSHGCKEQREADYDAGNAVFDLFVQRRQKRRGKHNAECEYDTVIP